MFTQKNVQSTQHARLGNWNVAGGLYILKLGFVMSNPEFAWVMNLYCIKKYAQQLFTTLVQFN